MENIFSITRGISAKRVIGNLALRLLVFFFLFNMQSCKKDDSISKNPTFYFDYVTIVIEHNEGLDYLFQYLVNEKAKNNSNLKYATEVLTSLENGTIQFFKLHSRFKNSEQRQFAITEATNVYNSYKLSSLFKLSGQRVRTFGQIPWQ